MASKPELTQPPPLLPSPAMYDLNVVAYIAEELVCPAATGWRWTTTSLGDGLYNVSGLGMGRQRPDGDQRRPLERERAVGRRHLAS